MLHAAEEEAQSCEAHNDTAPPRAAQSPSPAGRARSPTCGACASVIQFLATSHGVRGWRAAAHRQQCIGARQTLSPSPSLLFFSVCVCVCFLFPCSCLVVAVACRGCRMPHFLPPCRALKRHTGHATLRGFLENAHCPRCISVTSPRVCPCVCVCAERHLKNESARVYVRACSFNISRLKRAGRRP